MAPGLSSPLSFLPLPLSPPLIPCSRPPHSEEGPNLLTPTLSGGGTLARGICGSGLPGPPLVAPAQPRWALLETAWGCRAHHPSLQPRAPGAPWQPRDQRQKRGFVPGEGEARDSIQGAAPRPKNVATLRDPRNQSAWGCAELPVLILPLSAPPQSLLGGLPPLQGSFQPVMTRLCLSTVALELTPSPAPWPILLPCRVLASFGQIPESRSVENFLPHPLPGELRSQCCTHRGDLGR